MGIDTARRVFFVQIATPPRLDPSSLSPWKHENPGMLKASSGKLSFNQVSVQMKISAFRVKAWQVSSSNLLLIDLRLVKKIEGNFLFVFVFRLKAFTKSFD